MHEEASNCPHIDRLLASNDASAVDRFRDVVGWSVNYERAMSNPAKRRKVRRDQARRIRVLMTHR